MAHDFARKKPVKGASGARRASQGQRKTPSAWAWLSAGLLSGAFVSLLVYLALPGPRLESGVTSDGKPLPGAARQQPGHVEPSYAFYTLLPESEVLVPREDAQPPSAGPAASGDSTSVFVLQAGSFRAERDADRRRAELLLLGLDAQIQAVQVDNGTTWHRVQVGPFVDHSRLASARQRLADEHIESLLITQSH